MGFLIIFYKYMIQQYFTVTAPHSVFLQYLKQIKHQMLVVVHQDLYQVQWQYQDNQSEEGCGKKVRLRVRGYFHTHGIRYTACVMR